MRKDTMDGHLLKPKSCLRLKAVLIFVLALAMDGGSIWAAPANSDSGPAPLPDNSKNSPAKVITKDKRQNLSFEDELVEGQTTKPELFYLFQKKNFNYKRLIKLRDNFNPELRKSTEDIQRVSGRVNESEGRGN